MPDIHRERLHGVLLKLCPNAYFQPPAGFSMKYPCIVYAKAKPDIVRANNQVYGMHTAYTLTVIESDPEDHDEDKLGLPETIVQSFAMCDWNTQYVADNLYHTSLTLYY